MGTLEWEGVWGGLLLGSTSTRPLLPLSLSLSCSPRALAPTGNTVAHRHIAAEGIGAKRPPAAPPAGSPRRLPKQTNQPTPHQPATCAAGPRQWRRPATCFLSRPARARCKENRAGVRGRREPQTGQQQGVEMLRKRPPHLGRAADSAGRRLRVAGAPAGRGMREPRQRALASPKRRPLQPLRPAAQAGACPLSSNTTPKQV